MTAIKQQQRSRGIYYPQNGYLSLYLNWTELKFYMIILTWMIWYSLALREHQLPAFFAICFIHLHFFPFFFCALGQQLMWLQNFQLMVMAKMMMTLNPVSGFFSLRWLNVVFVELYHRHALYIYTVHSLASGCLLHIVTIQRCMWMDSPILFSTDKNCFCSLKSKL